MARYSKSSDLQESAGFLGGLVNQARLAWRVLNDSRVPVWVKLIPVAGLIYLVSPIDLIPDLMLPGLGELDDIAVLILAVKMFLDFSPPAVVSEHFENLFGRQRSAASADESPSDDYIDVPYRVIEPDK